MISLNEALFMQYWEDNLRGKTSAPSSQVARAYSILFNVNISDTGCGSCFSKYAQVCKNEYERLKKIKNEQ